MSEKKWSTNAKKTNKHGKWLKSIFHFVCTVWKCWKHLRSKVSVEKAWSCSDHGGECMTFHCFLTTEYDSNDELLVGEFVAWVTRSETQPALNFNFKFSGWTSHGFKQHFFFAQAPLRVFFNDASYHRLLIKLVTQSSKLFKSKTKRMFAALDYTSFYARSPL